MSLDAMPDVLTIQECADYLRVSYDHIKQLLLKGILHGINTGAKKNAYWRIRKIDLIEFMNRDCSVAPIKPPRQNAIVRKVHF